MLTEACLGGDLFSVLEKGGRLHQNSLIFVIACITEALAHLHNSLNVLHRDVKTENVLLDHNGIKLLSFNLNYDNYSLSSQVMQNWRIWVSVNVCTRAENDRLHFVARLGENVI